MRLKLLATKVSGCHPIPVILRARSRGRQPLPGGRGKYACKTAWCLL